MTILNLFIDGLILWGGSQLFPGVIQVGGTGTLILATILIWLITTLIQGVAALIAGAGIACESIVWTITGFVVALFSGIIAMAILSNVLAGFAIVGFWPKVLLAIGFSVFELSSHDEK